jgi:hypothetical protein
VGDGQGRAGTGDYIWGTGRAGRGEGRGEGRDESREERRDDDRRGRIDPYCISDFHSYI